MFLKPKFLAGLLFILVLSVTITFSMVVGIWKIEGREEGEFRDEGFRGDRTPHSASTNPNEQTMIDWCFQNQISPKCAVEQLGLSFEDMEKTIAEVAKSKGISLDKMKELTSGCAENGNQPDKGGEGAEGDNDND